MKFASIMGSTLAYAVTVAMAQGPIESCTYTATPCAPFNGPTETITVYIQPFTSTATKFFDCHGCGDVTVIPKNCDGVGIPIQTTTFVYENAQSTTTVDVCSPTPY